MISLDVTLTIWMDGVMYGRLRRQSLNTMNRLVKGGDHHPIAETCCIKRQVADELVIVRDLLQMFVRIGQFSIASLVNQFPIRGRTAVKSFRNSGETNGIRGKGLEYIRFEAVYSVTVTGRHVLQNGENVEGLARTLEVYAQHIRISAQNEAKHIRSSRPRIRSAHL